jgi:thioredoxin-like negative regulator of GroEL
MNVGRTSLAVLIGIVFLAGCSRANDVDKVLAQAKKEGKVVMLELGSVGCVPCEQMKPVMEKLRTDHKDTLEVMFIDVRTEGAIGRQFGIHAIPTQVLMDRTGKEFHRHIGFYSYEEIAPVLKKAGL